MNPIYRQRISKALDFIESNLSEPLSLDLISSHCHFSPFHFHRIFSGVMNETLNNYVARKRLEKAANLLVFKRNKRITDIAYDCGFSSSANFSKAIKQYFGYTPREIRYPTTDESANLGRIFNKYGKRFEPNDLYPTVSSKLVSSKHSISVEVKTLSARRLAKLVSPEGYESSSLFQTWDTLTRWREQQGNLGSNLMKLAWCYDNPAITPIKKCKYEASIEVGPDTIIEAPFYESFLPEGRFAVIHVKGEAEDIFHAQKYLFSCWLPDSSFEPDNLPMLERYLNDVRVDGFIETEILIKLKALTV